MENIRLEGTKMISLINNQVFDYGKLEIPTLEELRAIRLDSYNDQIQLSEVVADVKDLHQNIENKDALFQVASQFNLLEMIGYDVSPEDGIDCYEDDKTQGPICAMACGAGTIYRNYFTKVNGLIGQTEFNQIDCLEHIGNFLNDSESKLWKMIIGYVITDSINLSTINTKINQLSNTERELLKGQLKVGLQWNTEVTISTNKHKVSQIYCSALPISYNTLPYLLWEPFARLILEATYEATFYAALKNMHQNGTNILYLTLVGADAFGNDENWILDAIKMAILKFKRVPLDIRIVSYKHPNENLKDLLNDPIFH